MRKISKLILVLTFGLMANYSNAQTKAEKALTNAKEAIKLEQEGKVDEAIALLNESVKLDPKNIDYTYELAFAYYLKKDFKKAAKLLESKLKDKKVTDLFYQLLGNSYDNLNNPEKATKTYEKGIQKFPASGRLYLEMGNMQLPKKDYNKALSYYEKGIEMDPKFPSNYYWATKIFCNTSEEVWGMVYGEIFLNLETGSKRTAEISKLLFDTYKSEIKITSDTSYAVSFSKNATIVLSDLSDISKFKLPFGIGCYELLLTTALPGVKQISISSLDTIRTRFLNGYFTGDNKTKYPNVLFDYQKDLQENGFFEAYNYWILSRGDYQVFTTWKEANETKWTEFVNWFENHRLMLDNTHKFYRTQY